jgi:molybdopterin-containing oxidoreductase family iron-sulfur binding subunit
MSQRKDIGTLREQLEATRGREYWRSLEAVAETPEFKDYLHREFPENASEWLDPVGRRGFLKLMSASLALAGISACTRQPDEQLVPYVRQPEEIVPGKPLFYATAMPMAGAGVGLLVESHMGRPTKIEGNPDHPASRGATDLFAQAAILDLYDPDRAQTLTNLGDIRPFSAFVDAVRAILVAQQEAGGRGFRILTETVASPTLAGQIRALLESFPQAKWVQWEPAGRHNAREGSRLAFGEYVDPQYALDKADLILSLDSDFMCTGAAGLRYARAFAARRRIEGTTAQTIRFYAVEATPTTTGTKADHRLPLRASEIEGFAHALASRLGVSGAAQSSLPEPAGAFLDPLLRDLERNRGRCLVVAGDGQPASVHALTHAINGALGNIGSTVYYTQPAEAQPIDQRAAVRELVDEMNAGAVEFLLVLGGNPAYTIPSDLNFAQAMERVGIRAFLGLHENETAALCHWIVPETHFLEAWSDVRADDGTVSIVQPLIAPLYNGKSAHEVLAASGPDGERPGYDVVRQYWMDQGIVPGGPTLEGEDAAVRPAPVPARAAAVAVTPTAGAAGAQAQGAGGAAGAQAEGDEPPPPATFTPAPAPSPFDVAWRRWLHDGLIPETAFPPRTVSLVTGFAPAAPRGAGAGIDVVFRPDPTIYDGRFANNAWLQELPKPLTKLTWDNAALIAPSTASDLVLVSGDVVRLTAGDRVLDLPVWIAPGHAPDTVTLHLGYGRTRAGRVGNGTGFDVNPLRTMAAPDIATGVQLQKTGDTYELACTQDHWSLEGRNLIRVGTTEEFARDPQFAQKMEILSNRVSILPEFPYDGYAWGMAIDQNVCTGCNSCVVACQAENNIPVVGKSQVLNGREMHWLRVDRYYTGDIDNPDTYHQPMPCQQCEKAPCEVVCPVSATVHNEEGLNDMVYNRCVGTRYCSNNCPYKVRRFNFLLYSDFTTESLKPQRNPDVTIRSRGVMEKCTYCVQRISQGRITAKLEDRRIRDGEVLTACQSACPTDAIVFGDINDPESRVSQLKRSSLNYALLAELNTQPRTSYLAVVRNPNPEIEAPASRATDEGEA